jgi:hypothetical protein
MTRTGFITLFFLLMIGPAAFAGGDRYRVTLSLLPGDEPQTIEQQIAAITPASIESSNGIRSCSWRAIPR